MRQIIAVLSMLLLPMAGHAKAPVLGYAHETGFDIEFDQPMVTWQTETQVPSIRITPALDCLWSWDGDTVLSCTTPAGEPRPELRPATTYRVQIGEGLWTQTGEPFAPAEVEIVRRRPSLGAHAREWNERRPGITLWSDLPLDERAIEQVLDLRIDAKPWPYRLQRLPTEQTRDPGDQTWEFSLQPDPWPTADAILSLSLRPGLRSSAGDALGEADPDLLSVRINEVFDFISVRCAGQSRGHLTAAENKCFMGHPVVLLFSRPLSPESLAALARELPEGLALAEAPTECDHGCLNRGGAPRAAVVLTSRRAETEYSVHLPADLQAADGDRLGDRARDVVIRMRPEPSGFRVAPPVQLALPGAATPVPLEGRNVADRWHWDELRVGRRVRVARSTLTPDGPRNVFTPVPGPKPSSDVLERGGLAWGGLQEDEEVARATAVAAFQLLASEHEGRIIAWASDWASGRGVADARLELLEIDAKGGHRVLAQARTGADGVALFEAPSRADSGPQRVLRATSGSRRTVMPLNPAVHMPVSNPDADRDEGPRYWWRSRGSAIPSFGVSERLLYRPGEAVKYRVWLRDRQGNRLLRTGKDSTAMQLVSERYDTQHMTWKATLDEWGGVGGELRLPATLADGEYCIGVGDKDPEDASIGACFRVARFTDQALWVKLEAPAQKLRGGDRLHLDIEGGYYSGGPAAGLPVTVTGLVSPMDFAEAYPAYSGFTFIGSRYDSSDTNPLAGFTLPSRLDGRGRAVVDGRLPASFLEDAYDEDEEATPIPFGSLRFNAALQARGDASAASPTASVMFAHYARYVGLRSQAWWFSSAADPVLEGIVVDADGDAVPDATVSVRIERRRNDDDSPEVLAHCELKPGVAAACPFRAPAAGIYDIVAESADAAPARLQRWFGRGAPPADEETKPSATLQLVQAAGADTPARLRLRQPLGEATALFVVEYDGVLRHWTQPVGADTEVDIALSPEWAPKVRVRALIRPRAIDAADGLRQPTLDAAINLDVPSAHRGRVGLAIADDTLAPGEQATLRLHNTDGVARLVTVAVVDDSVHQQVVDLHDRIDPGNEHFLGRLAEIGTSPWFNLQDWKLAPNLFYRAGTLAQEVEREVDSDSTLDTIEVTGSRISRANLFPLVPATSVLPGAPPSTGGQIARTRSQFPEAAYWNTGLVLAAGERRELNVDLPDNLTRWRVLVWSSDADDGFSFEQATLTASLPLELRLSLPSRLYEDDQGSASISARAVGAPAALRMEIRADGAGVAQRLEAGATIDANATTSRELPVAPDRPGDIDVLARGTSAAGADAVSGRILVHSRWAQQRRTQAGWLEGELQLPLPALPAGARDPALSVTVSRGLDDWRRDWLDGLRAYPHRCWEQTLSRAVGAALALQDAADHGRWPEAEAVIEEAIRAAVSYQDDEGLYRYFPLRDSYFEAPIDVALSASTLRAYVLLDQLGRPVPAELRSSLQTDLAVAVKDKPTTLHRAERGAVAAGALAAAGRVPEPWLLDQLWAHWDRMSWFARSELVRAMAASPATSTQAAQGISRLREAGRGQGLRRVISDERDFGWAMGSGLRDQCAVTATLWDLDTSAEGLPRRREFLRGVQDLYAGGTPGEDTQASVHCLLALRSAAAHLRSDATPTAVALRLGDQRALLQLGPDRNDAGFRSERLAESLEIHTPPATDSTLNYRAELSFQLDQRELAPSATGFQLQRRYSVLRAGRWLPVSGATVREGDWVRVTLHLETRAWRYFVALTDPVPGGWVTRDPTLANVAGADLQQLAVPGSWWFDTRQTGADGVRMYAEALPPGSHEVNYYVQAVHPGRYFAPPATAELMYGRNSHASTAADDVTVLPPR